MSPDDSSQRVTEVTTPPRHDWAATTTDKVEVVVAFIRDRTVTPALRLVRYLSFGVLALFVGTLLAVLVGAGIIRVLDNYVFPGKVWASYLTVGGIFLLLGLFLSRMRYPR